MQENQRFRELPPPRRRYARACDGDVVLARPVSGACNGSGKVPRDDQTHPARPRETRLRQRAYAGENACPPRRGFRAEENSNLFREISPLLSRKYEETTMPFPVFFGEEKMVKTSDDETNLSHRKFTARRWNKITKAISIRVVLLSQGEMEDRIGIKSTSI